MIEQNHQGAVLIVDDNPTNIGVLLDYLSDAGLRVLVAQDGESALEQIEYARPDIILLDVMMPGIDGFETCRRLKANETSQDIPVIFMTAVSETIDKVKGFKVGAVDYITKPIQHEEVLARVKAHLTIQSLRKSLQEQNWQLQQEIVERQRLIAELDAFAHTVAHDLQNPLSVIIAYTEVLQASWATAEDHEEAMRAIAQNGQRMVKIIKELLLLAKMRKTDVEVAPLDMTAIVAEAQQRLVTMIEERDAEIIKPDGWPVALGHAAWVEEIWANYLSNAIKYGGQPPRVHLGAAVQSDGMVRFWVQDNGPGLTPEEQAKLFVPFTQLNRVDAEGSGLGLSIVQRIVEKLGGQVGLESDGVAGQGSIFSFTLPSA